MSFEIERAILAALQVGEQEPYELSEDVLPTVRRALARVVEGRDAVDEVKRALSLAVGLRKLGAVTAADRLEALLRDEPYAVAIVSDHVLRVAGIDEARSFQAAEGRSTLLSAPRFGAKRPTGYRLSEFLDPSSTGRIRQPWRRCAIRTMPLDP